MPLYLCRWPDGNLAIVAAWDVETALIRLDEFGDPDQAELRELDDLLVNLRLTDHGELQVAQWGDTCQEEVFGWAYPELDAALLQREREEEEPDCAAGEDSVLVAVERERERLEGRRKRADTPQPRSELGRQIQASIGAPTALADRLAEQVGTRILEDAEIDGPEN